MQHCRVWLPVHQQKPGSRPNANSTVPVGHLGLECFLHHVAVHSTLQLQSSRLLLPLLLLLSKALPPLPQAFSLLAVHLLLRGPGSQRLVPLLPLVAPLPPARVGSIKRVHCCVVHNCGSHPAADCNCQHRKPHSNDGCGRRCSPGDACCGCGAAPQHQPGRQAVQLAVAHLAAQAVPDATGMPLARRLMSHLRRHALWTWPIEPVHKQGVTSRPPLSQQMRHTGTSSAAAWRQGSMSGEPGSISFRQQSMAWLLAGRQKATSRYGRVGAAAPTAAAAANQSFAAGSESATRCALSCLTCFVLLQALGICRGARPASKAAAQPTSYVARFSCHVCWYGGWKGQSRRQSPLLCRHTGVPLAAPPSSYVPSHVLLLDQCLARHASRSGMHHCMARRMPESSADGSPPSLLHACCPRARP